MKNSKFFVIFFFKNDKICFKTAKVNNKVIQPKNEKMTEFVTQTPKS